MQGKIATEKEAHGQCPYDPFLYIDPR